MDQQAANAILLAPDAVVGAGKQPSLNDVHASTEIQVQTTRNPLLFADASGPDVVRAHQKDQLSKKQLQNDFIDVCNSWLGQRFTLRHQKNLNLASSLMYFSVNSLRGVQTLGEEYCDIRQVDIETNTEAPPSSRLRLLWWQELFPYIYEKALVKLNIITRPSYSGIPLDENPWRTKINGFIQRVIPLLKDTLQYFGKIHLALFYFGGYYYEWSKRMSGIKYIFDRPPGMFRVQYHILGLLIAIQLIISTYSYCKSIILSFKRKSNSGNEWIEESYHPNINTIEIHKEPSCVLCLEPRKYPTVAECGHIFCWNCIHDSCQNKPECPLCRQQIQPQNLTRLYHYSPSP